MQIAISGNIGSGKTSLTRLLAKHYGYHPVYGPAEENPYLDSYANDIRRWSFNMMVYSLYANIKQLKELQDSHTDFVRDRSLFDDAYIFAPNLQNMGLMTTRDLETYTRLFELNYSFLEKPDLIIYLKGDVLTLIKHIQRRGREKESAIRLDYLMELNRRYDEWAAAYTGRMLVVDIDDLNFVDEPEDLGIIINRIDAERGGLFERREL